MKRFTKLFGRRPEYDLVPSHSSHSTHLGTPSPTWTRRTLRLGLFLVPSLALTVYLLSAPAPPAHLHPLPTSLTSNATTAPPRPPPTPLLGTDKHCALRANEALDDSGHRWEYPSRPLPLDATLEARIAHWRLSSPVAPREHWVAWNNQTCDNPSVRRTANLLHVRESGEPSWSSLSPEQIADVREGMIAALVAADLDGMLVVRPEERGKRGIIFTAGNADTFERVIVSLRIIRAHGTELPVEVWHFAGEEPTGAQMFEYEQRLGARVRVVDVEKAEEKGRTKSFHIKGAAMLGSDFEEFIYLDSDSIPAQDVTPLFDSPAFKEHGAIFWSDFWKDQPENAIWSILGVQCRDEWTQEAGQLVLSKARHLDVLVLVAHMLSNEHWGFFFTLSDGDKDLFRYAFLALRKRWAVPGRQVSTAGWLKDGDIDTNRFCGTTMVQSDLDGAPLFVHANLLKRILGSFSLGSTWGRTQRLRHPTASTLPHLGSSPFPTPFILSADHLANTNSQGIGLVLAPPSVRARAAAERRLGSHFHNGLREGNYVLCVATEVAVGPMDARGGGGEMGIRDEEGVSSVLDGGPEDGAVLELEEEGCKGVERVLLGEEEGEAEMEWIMWEDDDVLKGFEAQFYGKLGVANGAGF